MAEVADTTTAKLILLVDDTSNDRQITRMRLEQLGYTIVEATDAETMNKRLAERGLAFKAVFLDQKLGGDERKGLELLSQIRTTYPDLPVIVYTATLEDLGEEAITRGAYWYLIRLFGSPYELANVLDNVVRVRQLRDERVRLFEENRFLTAVLNAVDQEVMVRKPDGTILWVNDAKRKAFPGLREELQVGPLKCQQFFERSDSICKDCISQRALETQRVERGPWYYPDMDRYQEITGVPIVGERGEVECVVELMRDVTRTSYLHEFAERVVALEHKDEYEFWNEIAAYMVDLLHFGRARVYRVVGVAANNPKLQCVATKGYMGPSGDPKGKELPFFGTLECAKDDAGAFEPKVTTVQDHRPEDAAAVMSVIDPAAEWLIIPVRSERQLQWQISVDHKGLVRERPFTDSDIEAARFISRIVSQAVANRQLREDLQWIRDLQRVLDTARDMKEAANGLLTAAKERGLSDFGSVVVPTYDRKRLRTLATDDHFAQCRMCTRGQLIDSGLTGEVYHSGVAEFVEDTAAHPLIRQYREAHEDDFACLKCRNTPVMAALPLKVGEEIIGVLDVFFDALHTFSEREKRLLEELARVLSSSLAIARRIEKAESHILQTHALASRSFILGGMLHRIRGLFTNVFVALDTLIHFDLSRDEVANKAGSLKTVLLNVHDTLENAIVFRPASAPEPEVLALDEVLREIVCATNLETRNSEVHVNLDMRSSPRVLCTRQSLDMALESLLQNAYDAVRVQGGLLNVALDVQGDDAVVKIEDNGPGFPEEMVIDPWFPLERPQEGHSGMGLYFANWALDTMGGRFEITRMEAGWTGVTVRIPLYEESASARSRATVDSAS